MVEAQRAFAAGDRPLAYRCLNRARIARGWIRDDLAQYRRQYGYSLLEAASRRPLQSLAAPAAPGRSFGLVIRQKSPKRLRRRR